MAEVKNNFFAHQETQPIESPPSSPSGDTVSFDNNTWIGEQMETQVMDIGCEDGEFPQWDQTQAVPLGCETQEVSLAGETQVLEASQCFARQMLDWSDNEIAADSNNTDVLDDQGELSDSDSQNIGRNRLLVKDKQHSKERSKSMDACDALSKKQCRSSGEVVKFTSVRTASFRASGLAARVAASKLPNSDSRSVLTNCHPYGKGDADNTNVENSVGEEVEQRWLPVSGEKADELRSGNKTARKLFSDDLPEENIPVVDCDGGLERLSYLDSQEPGEATQASALDFVDKLINDSLLNFEAEVDHGKESNMDEISNPVPSVNGPQVLAKKVSYRCGAVVNHVYNWDDNLEDEGGGEIFSRRKEEFFGNESCARVPSTVPKSFNRHSTRRSVRKLDERRAHSDSRILRSSLTVKGKFGQAAEKETKKNLVDEMDRISKDDKISDMHEVVDVGPDTQIAAEAIDALCLGDCGKLDGDATANTIIEKKLSLGEERGCSSGGVVTRQTRRRKRMELDVENLNSNKRDAELSNKQSASKQSSYPKRRRSIRNSKSSFDTPLKSTMPPKNISPICMGDEYERHSLKKPSKSHTKREFRSLLLDSAEPITEPKKSGRKRRELGSIRVLFSQHLDEDVTKHQKKILARFGISEASSMMEATHFVADKFVRTRNMLAAIASGRPVVTTQWLESIDQVKIYIDEDPYVLRDSKKEKEFGFNMSVSLARSCHHPLLQGKRVFITPNTKPGKDTIATLVKAVHGQAVERLGRSALKNDKVPDNLLVLSCEEDYDICLPFLARGGEIYSSELLLNGIVTQKLEYQRYRLFTDHVKRTRTTLWLKNGQGEYQARPR